MDIEMKLETDEEMSRRQKILLEIETIFKNWVKDCALNVLHLPLDEVENVGGQLFISGSHKLGVKEPGADIDTICVAPNFCTKELFFGSLKETFINHPKVTDFSAAEGARYKQIRQKIYRQLQYIISLSLILPPPQSTHHVLRLRQGVYRPCVRSVTRQPCTRQVR